jgi:hypothetical protein
MWKQDAAIAAAQPEGDMPGDILHRVALFVVRIAP